MHEKSNKLFKMSLLRRYAKNVPTVLSRLGVDKTQELCVQTRPGLDSASSVGILIRNFSVNATNHNIMEINGQLRTESGSRAAVRLRESGRVPGTLFSMKSNYEVDSVLLSFDKREIASIFHKIGSYGWNCQVFNVKMIGDEAQDGELIRALGRQIHVTAATAEPENVTMIAFPEDRKVKVNVPLKTFGKEVSPGIRAGGRVNWIRRTVPCVVQGWAEVPRFFEVNISDLEINDKVLWTSLDVPEGVKIALKDPRQPVLKMARR